MLNEKKIRVMTKLSMMEEDKEKFRIREYYMGDYVRYHLIRTVIRVTLGYLFILLLAMAYHAEALINTMVAIDYKRIGMYALLIYVLLLAVYVTGSFFYHIFQYKRAQRYITNYERGLGILRRLYQDDSEL